MLSFQGPPGLPGLPGPPGMRGPRVSDHTPSLGALVGSWACIPLAPEVLALLCVFKLFPAPLWHTFSTLSTGVDLGFLQALWHSVGRHGTVMTSLGSQLSTVGATLAAWDGEVDFADHSSEPRGLGVCPGTN